MVILDDKAAWLLSAQRAQSAGSAVDLRGCKNYGYLFYEATAASAIFNLEGSHNNAQWMIIGTYTATATQTGTAQIAGYFPYVRANLTKSYSAAGGSAMLNVFYAPGLK